MPSLKSRLSALEKMSNQADDHHQVLVILTSPGNEPLCSLSDSKTDRKWIKSVNEDDDDFYTRVKADIFVDGMTSIALVARNHTQSTPNQAQGDFYK